MTTRTVTQQIRGQATQDGAGVRLKRILGTAARTHWGPFLLLDEFRSDDPNDYIAGFPDHPHRGFETITYMLAGNFTHRDSKGHVGHLVAGSVQWMTAGRGIVHSEMPEQAEGRVWGFQLWLNLPARYKMVEARYQDIPPTAIPRVTRGGVDVRVIAGTWGGATGPGQTFLPVVYLDAHLAPGAELTVAAPATQTAMAYVYEGRAAMGPAEAPATVEGGRLALFDAGDTVRIAGGDAGAGVLVLAAETFDEPIARYGPFVMNTREEIEQAVRDYQRGQLG